MSNMLTLDEQKYLADHFRFTSNLKNDAVSLEAFMDKKFVRAYLDKISQYFGPAKPFVIASQFAKRYGYIMTVPFLYAMTIYDKRLMPNLSNCYLISNATKGTWLPSIYVKDLSVEEPNETDRSIWRETFLRELFNENVSKVLENVSQAASIPKQILWENIAIYVYWLYEKRIKEGVPNGLKRQILSDFYYLIHQAPGSLFGEIENPLQRYFGAMCETPFSEEPIRIRRTCCFYYELDSANGDCCLTCPKGKREIEQYNLITNEG